MLKIKTFRAYTRYQVTQNQASRAKRRQDSTDRRECEMRSMSRLRYVTSRTLSYRSNLVLFLLGSIDFESLDNEYMLETS